MTGTASQIEWAEQIRPRVDAEFDRVAKAFQAVAERQSDEDRTDTRAIVAILEEKARRGDGEGSGRLFYPGLARA